MKYTLTVVIETEEAIEPASYPDVETLFLESMEALDEEHGIVALGATATLKEALDAVS